jgi:hypothetical protein
MRTVVGVAPDVVTRARSVDGLDAESPTKPSGFYEAVGYRRFGELRSCLRPGDRIPVHPSVEIFWIALTRGHWAPWPLFRKPMSYAMRRHVSVR